MSTKVSYESPVSRIIEIRTGVICSSPFASGAPEYRVITDYELDD